MADFMASYWSWWVIVPTVVGMIALYVFTRRFENDGDGKKGEVGTTGHVWDGDLTELDNPVPRWVINLFYVTLFFGVIYLVLYPGLGSFRGLLGWTQTSQYDQEVEAAHANYGPLFDEFLGQDIANLSGDDGALSIGRRLYSSYCATCHGADARGARGFPDLTDHSWLFGDTPEQIETSIMEGRQGMMPAWEETLDHVKVFNVAQYVRGLSGKEVDAIIAAKGKSVYQTNCAACHGAGGKGNQAMGAPDLTDTVWLYGGSQKRVIESIAKGRRGRMPPHREFLGEAKVHVLAAYVYSLSRRGVQLED